VSLDIERERRNICYVGQLSPIYPSVDEDLDIQVNLHQDEYNRSIMLSSSIVLHLFAYALISLM